MSLTTDGKNNALDALAITHVSAHTAAPGDAGANELTGGSYARKAITMAAASAGNRDSSDTPLFDIPSGNTISHIGFWTALTGGTCLAGSEIKRAYTLAAGNAAGNGTVVVAETIVAGTPASGIIKVDGDYYAYSSWTGSTFTLSSVQLMKAYSAAAPLVAPLTETFGADGTYQLSDADISLS